MKNVKKYNEAITKNWNDYCEKLEDYYRRREDYYRRRQAKVGRINTKNRIAAIRKTIKYVMTGEADKDLALLLSHPPRMPKKSSR
jgi:hypothetical protein